LNTPLVLSLGVTQIRACPRWSKRGEDLMKIKAYANDLQERAWVPQKQGLGHKSKIGNVQIVEIFGDYYGLISVVLYAC